MMIAASIVFGLLSFGDPVVGDGSVNLSGVHWTFLAGAELAVMGAADCYGGCEPGQTVSLDVYVNGNDLPGDYSLDAQAAARLGMNQDTPEVGWPDSPDEAELKVSGTTTAPADWRPDGFIKNTPVTVTFTLTHWRTPPLAPLEIVATGKAVAAVTWVKYVADPGYWTVANVSYVVTRP